LGEWGVDLITSNDPGRIWKALREPASDAAAVYSLLPRLAPLRTDPTRP
jgi:hypothetical protein